MGIRVTAMVMAADGSALTIIALLIAVLITGVIMDITAITIITTTITMVTVMAIREITALRMAMAAGQTEEQA